MNGKESGVLVQYGYYKYNEKDKSIVFPYKEKGGLFFGEMDYETFKNNFCNVGEIPLILFKVQRITLKKFLYDIKNINDPWELEHFNILQKNYLNFVVASLKIINPGYNESLFKLKNNMEIPPVIKKELKKHEI